MRKAKYIFSPVELEYLKKNRGKDIGQLSIALGKPVSTVKRKIKEIEGGGAPLPTTINKNKISRIGKRQDLGGLYLRSAWEANSLRWLRTSPYIIIEYEPQTFLFTDFGIKRGTLSYTPDFKVINKKTGEYLWVEVKGFLKPQDKTKIRRFKKYYPEEFSRLKAITGSSGTKATAFFFSLEVPILAYYNELNKNYRDVIKGWEK